MIKHKLKEWLKRYLPAEIVGTLTALGAASLAHVFFDNHVLIAYSGSVGEAIGFYSTIFIQNLLIVGNSRKKEKKTFSFPDFTNMIKHMLLEFGPAGLIDGLFLRPFFMYLFPVVLNDFTIGILAGKLTGDITFYFLVILSYELKKHHKGI